MISIITVVLNAAADLKRTRLSIAREKQGWLEWVVVDGGSTDDTLNEIRNAGDLIDVLISERDAGIYDAMNKGCRAARGEFLWYMNAGDEVYPEAVARLSDALPSWDIERIYCAPWVEHLQNGAQTLKKPKPEELPFRMSVSHQATIHSKKALVDASMYDVRYRLAADYDFLLRVHLAGVEFCTLDFPLAHFYKGGATDQNRVVSKMETIAALWRNRSDQKWKGTRKYLRQMRKITRKTAASFIMRNFLRI